MSEERTLILDMLATGKINVEQAKQLLDAIDSKPSSAGDGIDPGRARSLYQEKIPPADEGGEGMLHQQSETITGLFAVGKDVDYIRTLHANGLLGAIPHDLLISLAVLGEDITYMRDLVASGLINSVPQYIITHLAALGKDVSYLKALKESGLIEVVPPSLLSALVAISGDIEYMQQLNEAGILTRIPEQNLIPLVAQKANLSALQHIAQAEEETPSAVQESERL